MLKFIKNSIFDLKKSTYVLGSSGRYDVRSLVIKKYKMYLVNLWKNNTLSSDSLKTAEKDWECFHKNVCVHSHSITFSVTKGFPSGIKRFFFFLKKKRKETLLFFLSKNVKQNWRPFGKWKKFSYSPRRSTLCSLLKCIGRANTAL